LDRKYQKYGKKKDSALVVEHRWLFWTTEKQKRDKKTRLRGNGAEATDS
jgi:hypothetical protein